MNDKLLSEFLSFNSFSHNFQKIFIIKRDFWGNFHFPRFTKNDDTIESKISESEIDNNLSIISAKNSKFLWLKVVNVAYLLMITLGLLGIPTIALLAYLDENDKMGADSFVLLVVTLIATITIFLGFIVALRRKILQFYTRKIRQILNEINLQKYIPRNLYWDVTELCMSIKLHELNNASLQKN